jgi:uncharacterized membrane protein YgdD (TMEM256/DUF423 family)
MLGAFGAHALRASWAELPDGVRRLEWWQTAANYHLTHAVALGVVALFAERAGTGMVRWAGYGFVSGTLLFSGSLYAMALTGVRALGAVTPLGGLAFLFGWGALFWAALRS